MKSQVTRERKGQEALFNFEDFCENRNLEKEGSPKKNGGVAQLGEHLPCKQGVRSSILLISTKGEAREENGEPATEKKGRIAQVVRAHA